MREWYDLESKGISKIYSVLKSPTLGFVPPFIRSEGLSGLKELLKANIVLEKIQLRLLKLALSIPEKGIASRISPSATIKKFYSSPKYIKLQTKIKNSRTHSQILECTTDFFSLLGYEVFKPDDPNLPKSIQGKVDRIAVSPFTFPPYFVMIEVKSNEDNDKLKDLKGIRQIAADRAIFEAVFKIFGDYASYALLITNKENATSEVIRYSRANRINIIKTDALSALISFDLKYLMLNPITFKKMLEPHDTPFITSKEIQEIFKNNLK